MNDDIHILIVDDNQQIQGLLRELMQVSGLSTVSASSLAEARERLGERTFACALVDLGLPDGNGLDLLPFMREHHPLLAPVILTGDGRAETIIDTMRAGAFDFVIKPFVSATLQAAVKRALEYHAVLLERDELVRLLSEEREQLKVRVEDATRDLRQYANHCELVSARLHSLVRLTQVAADSYSEELVFRSIIEELEQYLPLESVALVSATGREYVCAWRGADNEVHVVSVETPETDAGEAALPQEAEERVRALTERYASVNLPASAVYVYPQSFWGKEVCSVAFFIPRSYTVDLDCDQFLGMCAHFLGFEWQDARLSLHATQRASLGNIAVEISKGLIQGLTAIGTTADFIGETPVCAEAQEGLKLIRDNVEGLHSQIKDFRSLSMPRKDSVETVQLSEYLDQAVDILSRSMKNRGIVVERCYERDCECVLLNGVSLARTMLDLIAAAARTLEAGGVLQLGVWVSESSHILVQIRYEARAAELFGLPYRSGQEELPMLIESQPQFILAQRAIQSCGGKLLLKHEDGRWRAFHIILPRNPLQAPRSAEIPA
ncbi:MAG: response regulator [Candidatus Hydrogenedentes bacterium]|nr:response regulator [Candidatus Hydrogenedentota bacterium]